jgi:hypothetical protein
MGGAGPGRKILPHRAGAQGDVKKSFKSKSRAKLTRRQARLKAKKFP